MRTSNLKLFLFGLLTAGLVPVQNSAALTVTAVSSDNGSPAHEVQWTDSAGLPRIVIMVDQTNTPPYTGYLRRYTYQPTNGQNRVCTGTDNYPSSGDLEFSGDGFVQNHTAAPQNGNAGDFSSGDGNGVTGTTTITLQGTSHAIITYSMPTYTIDGPYYHPVNQKAIPTTVQWFFADGRDHPIFAISQDATQGGGNLGADSRSPYGDIAYDGDGTDSFVGGCSYGDTYQFITLATSDVTTNSGWDYAADNTIPYAMQWADPATANAEFGHVATLPIFLSDAGQDSQYFNGNATGTESYYDDNRDLSAAGGPMINDQTWAYQIFSQNPIWPPGDPTAGIQSHRVTWGANWGRVGGFDGFAAANNGNSPLSPDSQNTNYTQHSTDPIGNPAVNSGNPYKGVGNPADGTLMAYSVFVVLGLHSNSFANGAVAQQITQMQNVTMATLTVSAGTLVTNGPAGVGNATNRTISYSPAGFNPTYATWEIAATTTNTVDATLTPASTTYPLDHPVFVIDNYTSGLMPASIAVGTGLTNTGTDYFASLDTANHRLWITVNGAASNALNLVVTPAAGGAPAPGIASFSPTNGAPGTSVTIIGTNFTGSAAVNFNGVSATNFTVNSATNISAVVPVGATTGTITVTTPGGTATSAASFTIATSTSPPTYTITLNASPTDGGTVIGGGTFPAGSSQSITNTANNGFEFTGWTGDASGTSNPLTVIVNTNLNITANFAASGTNISLTLITNAPAYGTVTVSPKINDGNLKPGKSYTLTATVNSGYVFSNWTGSITTNKNPLVFKAETNMVLQANFIPNPFISFVGTYNGLFVAADGVVTETNAGMLKGLSVNSTGKYSGTLLIDGASHALTGSFGLDLQATNPIAKSATEAASEVVMTLTNNPAPQVAGTVFNASWGVANLTAYRATNTLPSGQYTMLIAPDTNVSSPAGYGYASITNNAGKTVSTAKANITGYLADGTLFTQSAPVSEDGRVPIYANLYSGKGLLWGWINLSSTNTPGTALTWIRPSVHTGFFKDDAFTSTNPVELSLWTSFPAASVLPAHLVIVEANDTAFVQTNNYTITITNGTTTDKFGELTGPTALTGTIAPKTGLFKVTFGKVTGNGVVLLNQTNGTNGGGYFLTTTNAGSILLKP
jgi:uncharacterized repeat protein (TIGR02543 family)